MAVAEAGSRLVGRSPRSPASRFDKEGRCGWFSPSRRLEIPLRGSSSLPDEDSDPFQFGNARELDFDALELADSVEKGLSREIVTEFMLPVQSVRGLQRFNVLRSQDLTEHRLFSDDYNFLLYARLVAESRRIDIFGYDPKDADHPFDPSRPAFTMSYNSTKSEWRLVQENCEACQFSPKHVSCSCKGGRQVAYIRQFIKKLGNGVSNCMEVKIPGFTDGGSPVVWCPRLGKRDLASPTNASRPRSPDEAKTCITKSPVWNEEFQCLVLEFEGRTVLASPSNFQLAEPEHPEVVVCQYGKIGPTTYSLDFKAPLSRIQAFGIALSTTFFT